MSSPHSVDFSYTVLKKKCIHESTFYYSLIRGVNVILKSLEDLRVELKDEITIVNKLISWKERLDYLTLAEGIKFLTLQMIPCILHLEEMWELNLSLW